MLLSFFLEIISFFSDKKTRKLLLFNEPFLAIFSTGLAFLKNPEEVISSGEVSEGSIALEYLMKVLLRYVTHFDSWLLKQTAHKPEPHMEVLFSIDSIVSLVSEMENKYSGTLAVERINTR